MARREALSELTKSAARTSGRQVWTNVKASENQATMEVQPSIHKRTTSSHQATCHSSYLRKGQMEACTLLKTSTATKSTWRIWIQIWRESNPITRSKSLDQWLRALSPSSRRTSTKRTICSRRWLWRTRLRIFGEASSAVTARSTSKWWATVTMVAPQLLVAVTRPLRRRLLQVSGQLTATTNLWAWTATLTHRRPSAMETKWWLTRVSSCLRRSSRSLGVSTRCNATLLVRTTLSPTTKPKTACSSRPPTSMSSPRVANNNRKEYQAPALTTRWTASVQKCRLVRTSTQSFQVDRRVRAPSSRCLTTNWSRRSSRTTRWWARIPRTVNRCLTRELLMEYPTSCKVTTSRWLSSSPRVSSWAAVSRRPIASAILCLTRTTSMSIAYQATLSTPPPISPSSRTDQTSCLLLKDSLHDLS